MSLASTQPPLVSYSSPVNDYMDHPAPKDPRHFDMAWGMPEFVDENMSAPDLWPNEYAAQCGPPSYPPYDSSLLAGPAPWSSSGPTGADETTNTRHYAPYSMPSYISSPASNSGSVHSLSHTDATTSARTGWSPNPLSSLSWDEVADDLARERSNAATPLATYQYPDELLSTTQRPSSTSFSATAPEAQQQRSNARSRSQTLSDKSDSIRAASGSSDSFIFLPHGGDRRGLHPPDVWEAYKEIIRGLYLTERRPLKEVVQIMEDMYRFVATLVSLFFFPLPFGFLHYTDPLGP